MDEPKFKEGDLVVCINDYDFQVGFALQKGHSYIVKNVDGKHVRIGKHGYWKHRFIKINL